MDMTVAEVGAEIAAFTSEIGQSAEIYASIHSAFRGGVHAHISVYPVGMGRGTYNDTILGIGLTWRDAFDDVRAKWAVVAAQQAEKLLRKMAIEIIQQTADRGECTDASLRAVFSPADVEQFGTAAITEANKLADGGPFAIVPVPGNNPPEDQDEPAPALALAHA